MDIVIPQQALHLLCGSHDTGGTVADPAGECGDHQLAHSYAGGEIVCIVLVHRVVGVYNRDVQPGGEDIGNPKAAELALGVDDVRPPSGQLPHHAPGPVHPQPRPGVDFAGADRAHIVDGTFLVGVDAVGEGDDPHIVSPLLQLPLEEEHRGHHAVDHRGIPVRSNEYFHKIPVSSFRWDRAALRPLPWSHYIKLSPPGQEIFRALK